MKNIKNTWKGIKSTITIKNTSFLPMVLYSQTNFKYQTSLIIILDQLLKKQNQVSITHPNTFLIS